MRNCFIAIIALFFLSSCGEKSRYTGRFIRVGGTNGIEINGDGTGFTFGRSGVQNDFTWELSEGKLECIYVDEYKRQDIGPLTLSFDDDSYLVKTSKISTSRYKRD